MITIKHIRETAEEWTFGEDTPIVIILPDGGTVEPDGFYLMDGKVMLTIRPQSSEGSRPKFAPIDEDEWMGTAPFE